MSNSVCSTLSLCFVLLLWTLQSHSKEAPSIGQEKNGAAVCPLTAVRLSGVSFLSSLKSVVFQFESIIICNAPPQTSALSLSQIAHGWAQILLLFCSELFAFTQTNCSFPKCPTLKSESLSSSLKLSLYDRWRHHCRTVGVFTLCLMVALGLLHLVT